ncbi:MAG: YggS family pyridoxal phosphate-dependent enzyme [Clostridia bacterium]|nr:YggS family pyridoxal phosphate-dependent enzyme [Clostridia bacterium]
MPRIAENIAYIQQEIVKAQQRSIKASTNCHLIAVTKTVDTSRIQEAIDAGVLQLGENRVQELMDKYPILSSDVKWHLIGHLQTNKVKYIVDKVAMIHSLDREDLAKEIERKAAPRNKVIPCLVQVNIAEEETKFGLAEEDVIDFVRSLAAYPHIAVKGLMTIGPYVAEPEEIRPVFRRLRELKEAIAGLQLPHVEMHELSMGMTNDYQVAVEEGATMVRVGSAIFGARSYV